MLSPYECVVHVALIKIEEIVLPNHRNEKAISNLETSTYNNVQYEYKYS